MSNPTMKTAVKRQRGRHRQRGTREKVWKTTGGLGMKENRKYQTRSSKNAKRRFEQGGKKTQQLIKGGGKAMSKKKRKAEDQSG